MRRPLPPGCLASIVLVLGCRTASPLVDSHGAQGTTTSPTPAAASTGRSAFVVLTATETIVIPTDPALVVERLPGHWVGALPGSPTAAWGRVFVELTTRPDPALPSLPVCPAGDFNVGCELYVTALTDDRHAALADASDELVARVEVSPGQPPRSQLTSTRGEDVCSCVVVHGISTDGLPIDPEDPEQAHEFQVSGHDSMEEYIETCGLEAEPELEPTAYFGGMLYWNGPHHNGMCNGLNLYQGLGEAEALRPEAVEPTVELPDPVGCQAGVPFAELDLGRIEAAGLACEPHSEQMLGYTLHRGRLVRTVGFNQGPEETNCSCASWLPVSPALCTSPLDPCGHGRDMPGRDAWTQLWVTTDERLALAGDDEGLAVLFTDRAEPIRRVPAVGRILGVEHHPDTALLGIEPPPDTVRVAIPARHESDVAFVGSAKAWGNRCLVHLRADRLDAAEAACFAGLLEGGTDGTRGALTYNLGRIAEARGDRERARAYYQRSLRLRPHEATNERLRALGGT